MKLIITEKPSVGQAYARVLGVTGRHDGYLEGNDFIVSWCVGHLVELAEPEEYDGRYGKWEYADLPILPSDWKYRVSPGTKKQFEILKKLMARRDVTGLINCCDAGREGELIFRLVYQQCGCRKPTERLWISSMEDSAIREGFARLRPGTEYDSLYEAALCRERADWIVGINATRLFSCLYRHTLNVGRVMTPTLAMVVMREAAIRGFRPEPFYTVQLVTADLEAGGERMKEQNQAAELAEKCREAGTIRIIAVTRKEKHDLPPLPYDLTSLQRDANRMLGFTAQQTLDYTQSLYEKKLVTYPRTDSRYLTEDMAEMLPGLVSRIQTETGIFSGGTLPVNPQQIVNNKKVSDHHAIIPTGSIQRQLIEELPSGESSVFKLIAARLLCAVGNPHCYTETTVELECAGQKFTTRGRTVRSAGWKEIQEAVFPPKKEKSEEQHTLPELLEGMQLPLSEVSIKEGQTSSPKHFTEDTLLQMMETAGAEEVPDEVERKGIGTPATRAGIIEKLVQKGFIERKGDKKTKHLIATDKGNALITVVPEQIQSPSLTADWEEKLLEVERGNYDAGAFMAEISTMITDLVQNYEAVKGAEALLPADNAKSGRIIGKCPACGSDVAEMQRGWFCTDRKCKFAIWKDNNYFKKLGKQMNAQLAQKLVRDGSARLTGCHSARTGKSYDATVVMTPDSDGRPVFELRFDKGGKTH